MSGVVVATMMRSRSAGAMPAVANALRLAASAKIACFLVIRGDVALADAGARVNPFVGGIHRLLEVAVGQAPLAGR